MSKKVCLVIPVFNEQSNIISLADSVDEAMGPLKYEYQLLFVDDGSTDDTAAILQELSMNKSHVSYLRLSRNFGHQAALKAGIDYSDADAVITLDGDGQHPPALLATLLKHWEDGYEVVYTIRNNQQELPWLKRVSSALFYKILGKLSDIDLEPGCADFRLLDKKVVSELKKINEQDVFLRGMTRWMGFRQQAVRYQPAARISGYTKYSWKKMTLLALQGITSFSTRPLYIAIYIGFLISALSLLYVPFAIYSYWYGYTVSGWVSLIVTVSFLGGLQLIILGIIGLYLGKMFMQTKGRPLYIIAENCASRDESNNPLQKGFAA